MDPARTQGSPHPALVAALRRLLRPLVRLMIREGMTYPAISALMKALYVEVAETAFSRPDERQTDSRITLLTGVHRKDVKRLRGRHRQSDDRAPPAALSVSAQILALWTAHPDYADETGAALPLPRTASDAASFDALVTRVSKDIRPRAVLDELRDRGLVRIDHADRVVLTETALVPRDGLEELAFYLGRNLHDHIAACDHNLVPAARPFIERAVYYDRLTPATVARLGSLAHELGMTALLSLNREANRLADDDDGAPDAHRRMSFGVYFYAPPGPDAEEG
jgi:hypothetical protein